MSDSSAFGSKQWLLLVASIFAGLVLLIESPLIAFPFVAGDAYQGINIAHFGNDEHHYLTRAKEVLEGHSLGQLYLRDGKDLPDSFQSNIEQVVLFPLTVTGLGDKVDIVVVYNILNALGLFVLLLLMYFFVYELSRSRLLALTSAVFVMGGYVLIENGTILSSIIHQRPLFYGNFNIFGRSNFPYMGVVPFFVFLIFSYRAVHSHFKAPREEFAPYAYVLGAGATFGFLFYDYLYAWTFALAFAGALTLGALVWRKWQAMFAGMAIGAIGLGLGSFKLVGFYIFFTSEMGAQISFFFKTVDGHTFIMSTTGLATALIFALYFYVRRSDENNFFIFALILAGWVALEQQLITGRVVQYGHYYWYFVVPLSIIVSLYLIARLVPPAWEKWWRWACIALIVIAFVNTVGGQYTSFPSTAAGKLREQDFAPILHKLQQLPKGVVLGDPGNESYPILVTIYTNDDVYWIAEAETSYVPLKDLKEAIVVYWYLNKDMRRDPVAYMQRMLNTSDSTMYTAMYEDLERHEAGLPLDRFGMVIPRDDSRLVAERNKLLPELGSEYRSLTASTKTLRAALEARGVRYILWDKKQYPEWDLSALGSLTLLATSTDAALYAFPVRK